jgi:hypothetical protein
MCGKSLIIAERKHPIPDAVAFRIDFDVWLRSLARRDRRIIAAFIGGDRTTTVAERFGISEGRVSQLRHRYEKGWRSFRGEADDVRMKGTARSTDRECGGVSKEAPCNTGITSGCREST